MDLRTAFLVGFIDELEKLGAEIAKKPHAHTAGGQGNKIDWRKFEESSRARVSQRAAAADVARDTFIAKMRRDGEQDSAAARIQTPATMAERDEDAE